MKYKRVDPGLEPAADSEGAPTVPLKSVGKAVLDARAMAVDQNVEHFVVGGKSPGQQGGARVKTSQVEGRLITKKANCVTGALVGLGRDPFGNAVARNPTGIQHNVSVGPGVAGIGAGNELVVWIDGTAGQKGSCIVDASI